MSIRIIIEILFHVKLFKLFTWRKTLLIIYFLIILKTYFLYFLYQVVSFSGFRVVEFTHTLCSYIALVSTEAFYLRRYFIYSVKKLTHNRRLFLLIHLFIGKLLLFSFPRFRKFNNRRVKLFLPRVVCIIQSDLTVDSNMIGDSLDLYRSGQFCFTFEVRTFWEFFWN